MRRCLYSCIVLSFLHCQTAHTATQVYKCTASNGSVTFSDSGCPSDSHQATHDLESPMTIPALPKHTIEQTLSKQQRRSTRVTVIGDEPKPCGVFDSTERRTQLIRKQVKSGMSRAEVDSMFGKPLKQRSHNGIISATYRSAKNQQRSVRFNQHGCVP